MRLYRGTSLRGKFFRVVLGGVVLPFVVLGLWLTQTARPSGEELLLARLDHALDKVLVQVNSSHPPVDSLVALIGGGAYAGDALVGIVDNANGLPLVKLPFDPALLRSDHFEFRGERWFVRRRLLRDQAVTVVAAGTIAPTAHTQRTALNASLLILIVGAASLGIARMLTLRLTASMEALASATDAVARGDLDRRVSEVGKDEIGRVGRSFNAMTESLRVSLAELSQREALAAVGGFAASLAHEVRNPLTSIRIDLQRVEERLPAESPLRVQLGRALREVARLDHTVSGALRVARSGQVALDEVDLDVPLQRAMEVARTAFDLSGAVLDDIELPGVALQIRGDEAALEQVFLNILLNAAQALEPAKTAGVTVRTEAGNARLDFWDTGAGIPRELVDRVFDPFFSTKKDGTGLGLAVARQIIIAHSGAITIDSAVDGGTTVTIRIPLMN